MYIVIDKEGYISQKKLMEQCPIKDMMTGCFVTGNIKMEDIRSGKYLFCSPYVSMKDDKFEYIALPANYRGNIYVYQTGNNIIFSSEFFELCKTVKKVHFNYRYQQHFFNASSLPLGTTWVEEIQSLVGHKIYYLDNGMLRTNDILIRESKRGNNETELYRVFKENFDKTVCEYRDGDHALLLSGGADSRLLALVMKKYGIPFESYTAVMKPYFYSGLEDVEGAERICNLIGVKNNLVYVDPQKVDISELDNVIEHMPFAAHISLVFIALMKQIYKDGKNKIWAGQNADTLYNLGPSGRFTLDFSGFMNLYKRFCITEEFYCSYPEVIGYSASKRRWNYMIAGIGCNQYNKMKKTQMRMPKTLEELVNNYLNSYDYTIFSENDVKREIILNKDKYTPHEIKKIIYNYKVKNFLKSGAPVVIDIVSALYGIKDYILPFSSEYMLPILQDIRLTTKNIFTPKKFIYSYIKEFEKDYGRGISSFDNISPKKCRAKYGDIVNIHTAYEMIMQDSSIGKLIRKGRYEEKPCGWTGVQYMQTALSEYWIEKVIFLLEEKYGVEIANRR